MDEVDEIEAHKSARPINHFVIGSARRCLSTHAGVPVECALIGLHDIIAPVCCFGNPQCEFQTCTISVCHVLVRFTA